MMYQAKYTLRDFYTEHGKSLKMSKIRWDNGSGRYVTKRIVRSAYWALHKKLHRVNGWHKMQVFLKNTGRGYCASAIWDAKIDI